jgi:hypothetical protein
MRRGGFFAQLEGVGRVLMRFNGQFMGAEMVAFAVSGRCGGVSVRGKVMQFGNPVMDTLWHDVSPPCEISAVSP